MPSPGSSPAGPASSCSTCATAGPGTPPSSGPRGTVGPTSCFSASCATQRPGDGILSEESPDDAALRVGLPRVWIVDPLDGTREFGEVPRDDWAVHVALWVRGALVAGAVARPARGDVLATDAAPAVPDRAPGPLRLAVSRSRPPAFVVALAEHLGADLVPMGSAGIKATAVVDGVVDAYVHAGGQYEWDSAAPVAVAAASGLHTSRIDGSALTYNRLDPLLPDLLVARPEVCGAAPRRHQHTSTRGHTS